MRKGAGAWFCHIPFTKILRSHRAEQTSTQNMSIPWTDPSMKFTVLLLLNSEADQVR